MTLEQLREIIPDISNENAGIIRANIVDNLEEMMLYTENIMGYYEALCSGLSVKLNALQKAKLLVLILESK